MLRRVEWNGLTMAYGRRLLFENVGGALTPGQTLVVTGANGAGKSTLLKTIAGLTRPQAGAVRFVIDRDAVTEDRGRFLGYAAPDANLYGELTARENLTFFARARGASPSVCDELLAQVGLARRRGDDLVRDYSSGMRQRLKLAASLLGDPPLLLWDEPTATLDAAGRERVEEILAGHRERGGLALIATNDPAEAERWGDIRLALGG